MKKKRYKFLSLILAICILGILYSFFYNPCADSGRVSIALEYCKKNNMNTRIILLCDFSQPSGTRRFMVYDTKKKKVILSSLCEQGKGRYFSNQPGSHCSSLGYYKVGYPHKMSNGIDSYTLKGLSATNSNAQNRGILIHPYFTVSELPTYPLPLLSRASKGCFILSPLKYKMLKRIFRRNNGKPILLYAYV